MRKQILIITQKNDSHPTSVINLLNEKNIPFFRLNTEDLLVDYEFAWNHSNNSEPKLYIKNKVISQTIREDEILSVWCRRPVNPMNLPYSISEEIDRHNTVEGKQFYLYLMYYLSDFYSIGSFFYDKKANSKMLQSKIAVELGIKIAPTCLSNTKNAIISFAKPFKDIGIKCLLDHWVRTDDGKVYDLATQKVDATMLTNQPEESFTQTIVFAQQYIEKKYELRVTVMGPHVFTCKLDSQSLTPSTGSVDWRQGYEHGLKHEMVETPIEIENFCRNFLRRMNLNFGCFDFIVTPENEYVFLECNPNGQWAWIEEECDISMSEALVDCLVNQLEV